MQTENEPFLLEEQGWIVRVQPPKIRDDANSTRTLLLLHGLLGNETVMWIFTRGIPKNYWLFAPRAPVQLEMSGYAWLPRHEGWPDLASFQPVAEKLLNAFRSWSDKTGAPKQSFDVMGFSQGAAMSYAMAAFYPQQVGRVLALAGFMPKDDEVPGRYHGLKGKKVYIAHGSKDEVIPVSEARTASQVLQGVGADVIYCESETGHKLSASCLRGLEEYFL